MTLLSRLRALRPRRRGFPRRLTFTRDGWLFCLVALGIGFAAMNTGNNLLYLLLAMMLSLIIASGVLSEASLRGLVVKRLPPLSVHAKTPFLMGISLQNQKTRIPSFSVEIEDYFGDNLLDKKCYFLKIPSGRTQQTSYRHTLPRRGRYSFTAFRISTKFPFALFRKSRVAEFHSDLLVYPELLALTHLPASMTAQTGELSADKRGRRGRFHGLRDYRAGDDPRDIHWRSSARRGRLVLREYEEEAVRQVTLYVDNSVPPGEREDPTTVERVERQVSWAASLCAHYLQRGFGVRLCARGPAAGLPLCVGPHQLPRFFALLALLPVTDLNTPFFTPEGPQPPGSVLLLCRLGQPTPALPGQRVDAL